MRTTRSIARLLSWLLLAAPLFSAYAVDQSTATPSTHHKSHKKSAPAPLVLPPLPSGPLSQVPMDQIPAAAPKITYQNGLLSIAAQNSTLGEILREVRNLTGASIEVPSGGANERVVVQLGPGAPRDVLAALLNGTSYNYVMLGSTSDPTAVATVLLSLKPSSSGEVQTAAANVPTTFEPQQQPPIPPVRMPGPQPFRQPPMAAMPAGQTPPAQTAEADESSDDSDADDKDDDSDQSQPGQPAQAAPQAAVQPDSSNQDPNQPNAGPKNPAQLLEMMRQRVQQGGGPGPVNPQQPPQD